jgi:hypothetical protein
VQSKVQQIKQLQHANPCALLSGRRQSSCRGMHINVCYYPSAAHDDTILPTRLAMTAASATHLSCACDHISKLLIIYQPAAAAAAAAAARQCKWGKLAGKQRCAPPGFSTRAAQAAKSIMRQGNSSACNAHY